MGKIDRSENLIDGDLAIKVAELLCDALYGDLARQKPLSATDNGTYWRVEGNWNRDGTMEGFAEFFLSIAKSDGRITDIGEAMRIAPHPSIAALFNGSDAQAETKGFDSETTAQCTLLLTNLGRDGLIVSGDLAVRFGEAFCQAHYGDLQRQMPLAAADKKNCWRVEGSWNRDQQANDAGSFFISIDKYDGRVTEIGE